MNLSKYLYIRLIVFMSINRHKSVCVCVWRATNFFLISFDEMHL